MFLGGLLAGVVLAVFGFINLFLFKEDCAALFEGPGRPPELTMGQMVYLSILTLQGRTRADFVDLPQGGV